MGKQRMPESAMHVAHLLDRLDLLLGGKFMCCKFDGTADMKKADYPPEDLQDLSSVIKVFAELDHEADGGVRTRYRRIFEHLAAWIYMGEQLGFIGQKAQSFAEHYAQVGVDQPIGIAAYVAAVQCKNRDLFSESFFTAAADGGPPNCALTGALSIRYHRAQGRRQVSIIGGEGECRL